MILVYSSDFYRIALKNNKDVPQRRSENRLNSIKTKSKIQYSGMSLLRIIMWRRTPGIGNG